MANCSKCGGNIKHIEAGISKKTGKHYNAFDVCESCGTFQRDNIPVVKETKIVAENDQGEKIIEALRIVNENITNVADGVSKIIKKLNEEI